MADVEEPVVQEKILRDRARKFSEFLTAAGPNIPYNYSVDMQEMLSREQTRLIVNIDDVRSYDREYADGLLKEPNAYLPAFDAALLDSLKIIYDQEKHDIEDKAFKVGFSGSFGDHHVNPRTLRAAHLSRMISLEGIVTRCSLVRPKLLKSIHYCPKTTQFHEHEYRDATMLSNLPPTSAVTPQTDDDGNPLQTEFGMCTFRDHQRISIQEMPERAPAGQLPRSTDVILDDDLVDKCKPGDRIQLVGIYQSMGGGAGSGGFRTFILGNNINLLSSKIGGGIAQTPLTDGDIRQINQISKRKNVVDLLSQSLAPSIYGHEYIKRAILLLLLGGAEKNLPNGTHIRGDINILMVGDPSTAKSQMLRFVLSTAPLAIATTGRGSSGVGLTAAVTTDKDTGERRLEAGAMVLADRGVVCIDEFDKMSDIDRVAIHEVMEQQTVTIAKAGIHTSLNARCSVIAAANPIYGQYDVHKDPHRNIALPDSLLSRFDLLFIVTDDVDEKKDRMISEHVLRMHRYLQPGVEEGTPPSDNLAQPLSIANPTIVDPTVATSTTPFEKYDPLLHGGMTTSRTRSGNKKKEVLSIAFIKKYLQYAKARPFPALSKGAADWIVNVYAGLRNDEVSGNKKRTSPLTARTLETMIRLSTAHAKARLSATVTEVDAMAAEEILRFALFKEVLKPERRKKRKLNSGRARAGSDDSGEESEDDAEEEAESTRMTGTENDALLAAQKAKGLQDDDTDMMDEDAPTGGNSQTQTQEESQNPDETSTGISPQRLALWRQRLGVIFRTRLPDEEVVPLATLLEYVNEGMALNQLFGIVEATAAAQVMSDASEILLADGNVYRL